MKFTSTPLTGLLVVLHLALVVVDLEPAVAAPVSLCKHNKTATTTVNKTVDASADLKSTATSRTASTIDREITMLSTLAAKIEELRAERRATPVEAATSGTVRRAVESKKERSEREGREGSDASTFAHREGGEEGAAAESGAEAQSDGKHEQARKAGEELRAKATDRLARGASEEKGDDGEGADGEKGSATIAFKQFGKLGAEEESGVTDFVATPSRRSPSMLHDATTVRAAGVGGGKDDPEDDLTILTKALADAEYKVAVRRSLEI